MNEMIIGARLHDYGKGSPQVMFEKIAKDGFQCTQLAYKKSIEGVRSYEDVTLELVKETVKAAKDTGIWVAVLGAYVELAINNEEERKKNVADFISQIMVAKALGSACIGTETTSMAKQPAGTTRERGIYQLCKSLEVILPYAEELDVNVGIEPVSYHSMNTPEATLQVLRTMQSPKLKVIFDPANLLTKDQVSCQQQLWERTAACLGEHIVAVHFKGETFAEDGKPVSSSLENSLVDYQGVFSMLKKLNRPFPVLREEAVPARAASDQAFMLQFMR